MSIVQELMNGCVKSIDAGGDDRKWLCNASPLFIRPAEILALKLERSQQRGRAPERASLHTLPGARELTHSFAGFATIELR